MRWLSLLVFLGFSWLTPFVFCGLTFHLTPGLGKLPQRIAGVGLSLSLGLLLSIIFATTMRLVPPFRSGARLYLQGLQKLLTHPWLQRKLLAPVESHKLYILMLAMYIPLFDASPQISREVWSFLAEGWAKNAFVATLAAMIILAIAALLVAFFALLAITPIQKRQWEVWDPVNMGFLYYSFLSLAYGLSVGFSLFGEGHPSGSLMWWIALWMGLELLLHLCRFLYIIAMDKMMPGELDPQLEASITPSTRPVWVGASLLGLVVALYLWHRPEGRSHALAMGLMIAFAIDRGLPKRAQPAVETPRAEPKTQAKKSL